MQHRTIRLHNPQRRQFNSPRRQRGQSIFELVIYAIVAAIVVAGAAALFFNIWSGMKVKDATTDTGVLVNKSQSLYSNQANGFTNATAADLINNGAVPSRMIQGNAIVSPLGGAVTVTPNSLYGGTGTGLDFNFAALSSSVCSDFVRGVEGWFVKIAVGGTTVKDETVGSDLDNTTLGTACKASSTVAVDFIEGK